MSRTAVDSVRIEQTRLTHGHLMISNDYQPACKNAPCGNQTIKHRLVECFNERNTVFRAI